MMGRYERCKRAVGIVAVLIWTAACGSVVDSDPDAEPQADPDAELSSDPDAAVQLDDAATAVCIDDGDCADPDRPFCGGDGSCRGCEANAECAELSATAPVCDGSGACRACDEHGDCSSSACHLDGPDQGACFQAVPNQTSGTASLTEAIDNLSEGDQAVIWLSEGITYDDLELVIDVPAEVAIIGRGDDVVLRGDPDDPAVLSVGNGATVYLANATIREGRRGIFCAPHDGQPTCNAVYLDDVDVVDNRDRGISGHGARSGDRGAYFLRRSRIAGTEAAGIRVIDDGEVHLDRSEVVRNGLGDVAGARGGIRIGGGIFTMKNSLVEGNANASGGGLLLGSDVEVDISYSTIVNNPGFDHDINCSEPPATASGSIRNSIIFTDNTEDPLTTCPGIDFEHNALNTDPTELGETNVETGFLPTWFDGDSYLLTQSGARVLEDIAQWQQGDPGADVEGNPIPTEGPSYPGMHQYQGDTSTAP